jgi:hypothetical protein
MHGGDIIFVSKKNKGKAKEERAHQEQKGKQSRLFSGSLTGGSRLAVAAQAGPLRPWC